MQLIVLISGYKQCKSSSCRRVTPACRLRRWAVDSFFPPHLCEATVLGEGVSDHGHECMTMEALPGSSLKVIKPEFLLQLLMGRFANPSRLDSGS